MDNTLKTISPELSSLRNAATERIRVEPAKGTEAGRQQAAEAVTETELLDAVKQINDFIQVARRDLVFSVDERTGQTVVTVVDAQTQEVIRQIPSEEVLAIAARLDEARGLLFESKV